jgi:hypothetical protein
MMTFNPTDYRPPPRPPADDMEDVQTAWGILPRWKARALCLGEVRRAIMNDDAAVATQGASQLSEEEKPPPLVADTEKSPEPDPNPMVEPDIVAKVDELIARFDRYVQLKRAETALEDTERQVEAEMAAMAEAALAARGDATVN